MMDEPQLYPPWRQAEADLAATGLRHGQIISTEWLEAAFGITKATTIAQFERNQLVFLRQITALRESLLCGRKMMLVSEPGVGYRIALPEEQTKLSMHQRTKEIKSAMRKMLDEVTNVAVDKLTDDQRKEHADALAKIGSLRAIARKQLK